MVGFVSEFSTYPGKRCRKPATITLLKYYIWHLNAHCSKLARVAYLKPKWFRTYMVIAIQWGMSPAVRAPITFFLIYRHRVSQTNLACGANDRVKGVNNNCAQSRRLVCVQMANMGLFLSPLHGCGVSVKRVQLNMHSAARKWERGSTDRVWLLFCA